MSVGAVNKSTGDRIPTAGMPAIDDALDLTSVNPVQNAVITAALANKQDKTDNSLQTTDKTVVGAVNELKSGLTNFNVALSVPENSGKNLIPLTIDNLKAINTNGTWSGNAYTINGVTFTGQTDSNGNITSIVANGTATGKVWFRLVPTTFDIMNGAILSGITNGSLNTFSMYAFESNDLTVIIRLTNGEYTFTNNYENVNMYINILSGVTVDNITFYPMLRPAGTTPTFAPYIPSVESRIEAVESGLTNVNVALSVPDGTGKNVLPMTLAAVKAANTVGTWSDNAYTVYDVTFTVQTDGDDNVVGITSNGTATHGVLFYLYKKGSDASFPTNDYILTGCADGGSNSTWRIIGVEVESGSNVYFGDSGSGATFNTTATKHLNQLYIEVFSGVNINNKTFYPMVRPATITDPTFAPYIPSVESRIEAVENKQMVKTSETVTLNANGISRLSLTLSQGRIVYAIKVGGGNDAYLVLPYCTTVDGGVWAVKVVDPTDMSPIASAEVTIAYGYLP